MTTQTQDETAFLVSIDGMEDFIIRRKEVLEGVKSFVRGVAPETKISEKTVRFFVGRHLDRTVDRAAMEIIRNLSVTSPA